MDLELEEMTMRYDATGDTSHLSGIGHVVGGGMYAEGCLDRREICVGVDRTRRVLIAADAWGRSMANALYQAAQINVSNEPCLDDVVGLEAPGDLDTRGVLYSGGNTRDVLNAVGGRLDSAQESLYISTQIDVLQGSQRDEGVGAGFQDPPAAAGVPIESRGVVYVGSNTQDVLNAVRGWLDSAQESLYISTQIDVLHGSQRDEGIGEGFQDPPAVAGVPIESNIQVGGGGGGGGVGGGGGGGDGDAVVDDDDSGDGSGVGDGGAGDGAAYDGTQVSAVTGEDNGELHTRLFPRFNGFEVRQSMSYRRSLI